MDQYYCIDLMQFINDTAHEIIINQVYPMLENWMNTQMQIFQSFKENLEAKFNERYWPSYRTYQEDILSQRVPESLISINKYWLWEQIQSNHDSIQKSEQLEEIFDFQKFDTYKALKKAAKVANPFITKEEIYEELLKPFRYEKVMEWSEAQHRYWVSYTCKSSGWNKHFKKIWNMLDHMRMHEGIKPFVCELWKKSFTQKGNLK